MKWTIFNKIKSYKEIEGIAKELKGKNKKIVFITGCYDLLHLGHALFFEKAKNFGDILIVGLGSDKSILTLKKRLIYPERIRAGLIAAQSFVDYVVINKERIRPPKIDHKILISKIKPDFFVLNDNDSAIKEKRLLAEKYGGKLILVPRNRPNWMAHISTTQTYEKIKKLF